jgi:hypothetical protein
MEEDDEYKVGPKRPPREHQFKKGQSGNPRGRPKGSLSKATLRAAYAAAFLDATVPILVGGQRHEINALEALLKGLMQSGLKGDLKATLAVLDRLERFASNEPDAIASEELPEEDAAILQRAGFASSVDTPLGGRSEDEDEEGDLVDV